jgi:peptidoglycan/xylan/chitin deacetylase (PgdA/CDA1 family)
MHTRWLRGEAPAKPFLALTFDDGQRDNYDYALPILSRHNVSASFFIPVEAIEQQALLWHDRLGFALQEEGAENKMVKLCADLGARRSSLSSPVPWVEWLKTISPGKRFAIVEELERQTNAKAPPWAAPMHWGQIQDLARKGHEIGSHSMSHRMMNECRGEDLEFEVRTSREILESKLQVAIHSFCYPNGNVDLNAEKAVKDAGYIRAVTTQWGTNSQDQNPFALKRFDLDSDRVRATNGQRSSCLLAWRMSGLFPLRS